MQKGSIMSITRFKVIFSFAAIAFLNS